MRKMFIRLHSHFRQATKLHNLQVSQTATRSLCLTSPEPGLSVQHAVDVWTRRFEEAGVPEPDLSTQYIVAHVLGAKTMVCLGRGRLRRTLTDDQTRRVWELCAKRLKRLPVQYVIQEWDFLDLTLKLRPPVFIPRPETEELVGLVLAGQWPQQGCGMTVLEVGCGSGAVSLSLLHRLPQLRAMAIDTSAPAVSLTVENAERLGLRDRLTVHQMDVIEDAEALLRTCAPVDCLVSNPPYLFSEDMASLDPEIHNFEDHAALDGGADGMKVIRQILSLAPRLLKDKGRLYLEVDPRHPPMIQQLVEEPGVKSELRYLQTHCDFTRRLRFTVAEKRKAEPESPHLG